MTEKEKIILKHTQLAREYSELANSPQRLTQKEWQKIDARMNAILIEIDELKRIEKTWSEFQEPTTDQHIQILKTVEEVAKDCKCSRNQVTMWLEIGLMKAIKTGKGYMIPKAEFDRFLRDYLGFDISNRVKALKAYEVVNSE